MKKLLLGKLIEEQYIPASFSSEKEGEWSVPSTDRYAIFSFGNIGDVVQDDNDYSYGEYGYENRKWKLIQEIIPVL